MEIEITWEDIIRGLPYIGIPTIQDVQENNERSNNSTAQDTLKGYVRGHTGYNTALGKNYTIRISDTKTSAVSILDKTIKGKNKWVARLDNPHAGVPNNHININSKISGVTDPHIGLPNGSVTVGKGVAKTVQVLNKANKVLLPLAVAVDTYRTGKAAYTDYENGTTRNTVETVSSVAGGWGGGYGGAVSGAAIGSAFFPGIGTIVGGIIGGLSGGIGGSILTQKLTSAVSDKLEYDIIEKICLNCELKFKARGYLGENICVWCQQDNFVFFVFLISK